MRVESPFSSISAWRSASSGMGSPGEGAAEGSGLQHCLGKCLIFLNLWRWAMAVRSTGWCSLQNTGGLVFIFQLHDHCMCGSVSCDWHIAPKSTGALLALRWQGHCNCSSESPGDACCTASNCVVLFSGL